MPTIVSWPATDRSFVPREFRLTPHTPKSSFSGFFSGQSQTVSHLADRLLCSLVLPACEPLAAARREAFFLELAATGNWVRLHHMQRAEPNGTLRGAPTLAAAAAVGARAVSVQGAAGATLLGGDVLGAVSGQLLLVGYDGAVANGSGVLTVPLVFGLRAALSSASAITWQRPATTFQLTNDSVSAIYGRAGWQAPLELNFREVW